VDYNFVADITGLSSFV